MGAPAARQGDHITGTDVHIVLVPSPTGPVPTPQSLPFAGVITGGLSTDVTIMGQAAAVAGSTADNTSPHVPLTPGTAFQRPPGNRATVRGGSTTVRINGKPAARSGDPAMTCNDPADQPVGTVLATGTVMIG